jgi:hypothetical protein
MGLAGNQHLPTVEEPESNPILSTENLAIVNTERYCNGAEIF